MSFSHRLQEGRLTGKGCSASRREPLHRLIMKSINLEVCASVLLWHPIGHGAACVLVESLLKLFFGGDCRARASAALTTVMVRCGFTAHRPRHGLPVMYADRCHRETQIWKRSDH